MTFILSKLLWAILKPSVLLYFIGLAGLLLLLARQRRIGRILLTIALGSYLLILLLPIDIWLARPIEDRFPRPDAHPAPPTGIIVLGGSTDLRLTVDRGIPSLNRNAERLTTFVELARRYPSTQLAFTGGSGDLVARPITEADVARTLFEQLGLEGRPIVYESRSRNTFENAVFLANKINPQPDQTWLLVTSALHMPRAVGCFRAAGWHVAPWPVAYRTPEHGTMELDLDLPEKLVLIDSAVREWVGLAAYWLMDRTSALFPAP